jgi:hypothetical protein
VRWRPENKSGEPINEDRKLSNRHKAMSDTTPIPGQGTTYSYGLDDYGEYGSALQPETEFQVPEPLDYTSNSSLEQSAASA